MIRVVSAYVVAAAAAALAAGCGSTRLINTWQDPTFSSAPVRSVLVIGVTKQAGMRRTFEDEFVRQLRAKGVRAVPSYTLVPEDGEVPKARLAEAVMAADVQAVLITRLVKVQWQMQGYPAPVYGPPYMGWYGFYSSAWGAYYEAVPVYGYDIVTAETDLFAAATDVLIWAGTTESFPLSDVKKGTRDFAQVIVAALDAHKLI
ncbi:MAG TPA: hypothetical protein VMH32_17000 [Burkholderiales bacterium]|nr:hypothetical protein [Burkholderiales bacterium]